MTKNLMTKKLDYIKRNKILLGSLSLVILLLTVFLLNINGNVRTSNPKTTIHASGSDTLSLSPVSGTYNMNSSLVLTVTETSATTDAVNAVEADLSYNSSELRFVSAACSSTFSLSGAASGGSGSVSLACATPNNTVTGAQTVGTVTFTVIGGGSSVITFAATSAIILAANQTNTWDGVTAGGTYTLATPPTTSITSPAGSAYVHGTALSVTANANDVIGVTKTELYVDGSQVATDTASPFTFTLNTIPYKDGNHALTSIAFDAAGLSTTSTAVTVLFNNGDVNGDVHVNLADLAILASNWSKTGMTYAQGDLSGDGKVNISDLSILANYYGQI
jgi:hypothetical protein